MPNRGIYFSSSQRQADSKDAFHERFGTADTKQSLSNSEDPLPRANSTSKKRRYTIFRKIMKTSTLIFFFLNWEVNKHNLGGALDILSVVCGQKLSQRIFKCTSYLVDCSTPSNPEITARGFTSAPPYALLMWSRLANSSVNTHFTGRDKVRLSLHHSVHIHYLRTD